MALPASGCKHTSSSGATNPLGRAPRASRSVAAVGDPSPAPAQGLSAALRGCVRFRVPCSQTRFVIAADVLPSDLSGPWSSVVAQPFDQARVSSGAEPSDWADPPLLYHTPPWSDVRLPAELKHITKRRRRKQP
jgi:hypothetical protein